MLKKRKNPRLCIQSCVLCCGIQSFSLSLISVRMKEYKMLRIARRWNRWQLYNFCNRGFVKRCAYRTCRRERKEQMAESSFAMSSFPALIPTVFSASTQSKHFSRELVDLLVFIFQFFLSCVFVNGRVFFTRRIAPCDLVTRTLDSWLSRTVDRVDKKRRQAGTALR